MSNMPDAVLWDMDGTLLDSEKLWDIAVEELAADLGAEMTPELRLSTLGNATGDALRKIFAAAGNVEPSPADLAARDAWLSGRVIELFEDGIPWMDGARDALELVAGLDIPMVLVTNTVRDITEHALGTLGRDRFAATVCGDEVPAAKPAPDPYLLGAELADAEPGRALAFEDSPTGSRAALAAGCTVVTVGPEPVVPGTEARHRTTLAGLAVADLRLV
ncbi:HAD family phosphatase [Tsukamurella sp. 8F]|uniref:HAD family hydrolase n=1 Tax=unclassified Tsukamurella TaxID=2633480 RepID=UPI0023B9902E|nr:MULTISPECIES: HAD family phosphatase [unclassified Tsukamurella]MDF0530529.1 HAD family phosphatase [Tsukamurella sp. 8J]MDF0586821.1 HAD family phosphatase [Tsukamurella sp. 8F]